jgi:hypothetical protein
VTCCLAVIENYISSNLIGKLILVCFSWPSWASNIKVCVSGVELYPRGLVGVLWDTLWLSMIIWQPNVHVYLKNSSGPQIFATWKVTCNSDFHAGIPTKDIEIRALSMTTITKSVYTVVLCETMPIVFHTWAESFAPYFCHVAFDLLLVPPLLGKADIG